jgi:hypothetical protein
MTDLADIGMAMIYVTAIVFAIVIIASEFLKRKK